MIDRSQLETEKRLASAAAIDALNVNQTLALMNTQDLEVPRAIRTALPSSPSSSNRQSKACAPAAG